MNAQTVLAYLRVTAATGSDRAVAITQSPFSIGRAEHNDLILTAHQVSRHHASLRFEGDLIYLVDMQSENGTWIGTEQLEANQPRSLAYHEVFRIGPYQLQLEPIPETSRSSRPDAETVPLAAAEAGPVKAESTSGSTPQPMGALIEFSPKGHIGVLLKTPLVTVKPGESTNISLVIINQSQQPDGFHLTLAGVPDQWLPAPPPVIELPADVREEVNLTIHPPRSPETRTGRYRVSIQITSRSLPAETIEVRAELIIAPYAAFSSALHPPRTGVNDPAQVVVRNDGNASQVFTVKWLDPEERYEFRPAELQMTLMPGETAASEFRAVPHRRRWFGGSRLDVYSVRVTPEEGPDQSHTGQIVTTGVLPTWTVALFLLVTLCGVASGVGALALINTGATTPTPTTILTATPVITPTITLTATVSGLDSDGDGLSDEEEIRLGTDPRSPDTDRDGLTDLDEMRRGTSPTLIDSDGDTLLDGQEAFGCSDPRNPDTDGDGLGDNVDPDPCRLPTITPPPTATPIPTSTPFPTNTPVPTLTPLPTATPLPTNTPVPTPTPVILDWRGEYYGNPNLLDAPLVTRNDIDINFNWGRTAPDPSVPADNFSARWTRTLNFESRAYRFSIQADDGVRVFIDDSLIINEWHPATPQMYTADVNLAAGAHVIRVEFYEGVFDAYVLFKFEPAP